MIEHTTMNHRLTVRTKPNADNLKTKNKEKPQENSTHIIAKNND